jgi:hypothetical protein
MHKGVAIACFGTLILTACSETESAYTYRPVAHGGASQGNATTDELRGGLPAGAEQGSGANAGPRTTHGFGLEPGR